LKVIVFSWQALLGRLPTRANLLIRGIIQEDEAAGCLACAEARESENHLLVACPLACRVWAMVHKWFGLNTVLPDSISIPLYWRTFSQFIGKERKVSKEF
jgi:hypothetical protein